MVFYFFAPVRWAKGFTMSRRKTAAAVFVTAAAFLYKENHALDAWFNKAYGDEQIAI